MDDKHAMGFAASLAFCLSDPVMVFAGDGVVAGLFEVFIACGDASDTGVPAASAAGASCTDDSAKDCDPEFVSKLGVEAGKGAGPGGVLPSIGAAVAAIVDSETSASGTELPQGPEFTASALDRTVFGDADE